MSAPETLEESAPHWAAMLWAIIFIGLPVMVAVQSAPFTTSTTKFVGGNEPRISSTPRSPPPPIEPVKILALAPETARAVNAAVPFSSAANPAARPFRFAGDTISADRATDCLAAAQLYEAGDDTQGQKAVAQVVLNRLRHPAFPKTVCEVVFQGSDRTTGCQFTFTCDGALVRIPSVTAWARAQALARQMLAGTVDKRVGYATHYHTDWVVPYWSSSLDKITSVGTHLFFRWKGWWGTPGAFGGKLNNEEPIVRKLAALSPVHRNGMSIGATAAQPLPAAPDFSDLARPAMTITADRIGDRFGPARLAALNSSGDAFVMVLDRNASPASLEQLARQMCGGRTRCRLLGWSRASDAPNGFPIDDETLASMSYAYMRATGNGLERSLYNCREFKGQPKEHCMRERTPVPSGTPQASSDGTATTARGHSEVIRITPRSQN
ncbi:MAG: cell wall hydrolase [Sphingobium sp.]